MTLEIRKRERLVWVVFLIFTISLLSGGSILIRTVAFGHRIRAHLYFWRPRPYFGPPMPMTAVTNVPADTPLADELADEDLVEMANLPEEDTGIPGTIFVSTRMGRHGPRVKYFDGRAGEAQPSCSVTIADPPRVVANSLPDHVVRQRAPLVCAWVALNRDALLQFWNEGASWTRAEVPRFLDGLKRLKER